MQRVKRSTAVAVLPVAPSGGTPGYFAAPDPAGGVPATVPGYEWYNGIQEEICAVIAAAGLTPSAAVLTQLLQALPGALASRPEMARSLGANGYQKLPGGLILQWGSSQASTAGTAVTLPIAFPTGVLSIAIGGSAAASNGIVAYTDFTTSVEFKLISASGTPFFNWLATGY